MKPTTEVELAAPVRDWLEAQGWDVYQEVKMPAPPCEGAAAGG